MDKLTVTVDADIQDLIPGFLANRHRDVTRIADALAAGDFDAIRLIGHSMKGAGGGYGFDAVTEIGARIEQGGIARDATAIESASRDLATFLQRVEVVYS